MTTFSSTFTVLPTSTSFALVVSWEITEAVKAAGEVALAHVEQDNLTSALRAAGWIIRAEGWSKDYARLSVVAEMPTTEVDVKSICNDQRLTGRSIRLADGAVVVVERHNAYVLSGWDSVRKWWAIDLRNEKATLVA